ncbi:MAG: hypothetical protein ACI8WB_000138 [Phenylobacterium sp.]|jgi:hypothetical protein
MLKKLIVGAVILGAGATVPFYLSGHFAASALADYTSLLSRFDPATNQPQILISNVTRQSGLYDSSYGFDVEVKLDTPAMAALKDMVGADTVKLHIDNKISHGFLSVTFDTSFDSDFKVSYDKLTDKLQQYVKNKDQPWMTLITTADFSVTGDYHMKSDWNLQGFDFETTDQLGELININSKPLTLSSTMNKDTLTVATNIDNITMTKPSDTLSFNQFSVDVVANFIADPFAPASGDAQTAFSVFKDQDIKIKLDSVLVKSADKEAMMLEQLDWHIKGDIGDPRAMFGSVLTVAKAGNPTIPMTVMNDVTVDLSFDVGTSALTKYSQAMQGFAANPQDPSLVLASVAHLLSENVTFTLNSIKLGTFAGLVDLSGNIDLSGLDMAQFQANPTVAIGALSYAAQGQVPRDLLMMSGQLDPELIDNLLAQQMLEQQEQQILFKLTGEAGHVSLNGKPLM